MIEFHEVSKVFASDSGDVVALRDFSLRIADGETHALLGTSGSGKTTALRLVNRLEDVTSGRVSVDDRDVRDLDVIALRRRIGYVLQSGGLFPHMTVEENVGILCDVEGWKKQATRRRVAELLELVGLPIDSYGSRYPFELSGGQSQRVGVARALALDPGHVLMDEPFGALDPITRSALQDEFQTLLERVNKTVVFVTHDVEEAFRVGDRVSILHEGGLVQTGTQSELLSRPVSTFVSDFLAGRAS